MNQYNNDYHELIFRVFNSDDGRDLLELLEYLFIRKVQFPTDDPNLVYFKIGQHSLINEFIELSKENPYVKTAEVNSDD